MFKRLVRDILCMMLIFGCAVMVHSQTDSTHWEADLVVRHPSGLMDTLTVGADLDGGTGYQSGLDEIDTNFALPFSIRSHDTQVAQQYNTCHANMIKDIRGFHQTITYSFYIKSDMFPRADLYPPDSCVSILYDTTQLKYENSNWSLLAIKLTSFSGYLGIWDAYYRYLVNYGEFGSFMLEQIPLIYEGHPFIDYWSNPCGLGNKVMKFELEVQFSLKTGVDPKNTNNASIINDGVNKQLDITFSTAQSGRYWITNLMGQYVASGNFHHKDHFKIPYQLNTGGYVLLIDTRDHLIRKKFVAP